MNSFPDININQSNINPYLTSPNAPNILTLNSLKEEFDDVDYYKSFLTSVKSQFRHSREYKSIKASLFSMGLNRSQINGNLTDDMCTLEMHHCILTLENICLLITEHTIQTVGFVNSMYVINKLIEEHKACNIPLVMLDKTTHQLADNTDDLYIHPKMIFGNWYNLLTKYPQGITTEIAYKVINYLSKAYEEEDVDKNNILQLRDFVLSWENYNA